MCVDFSRMQGDEKSAKQPLMQGSLNLRENGTSVSLILVRLMQQLRVCTAVELALHAALVGRVLMFSRKGGLLPTERSFQYIMARLASRVEWLTWLRVRVWAG